jgi:GPN-loop GTPase
LTKCAKQKEEEDAVKKEEQLKEAIKVSGEGSRVPLCSTLPASHGLSDIYLKHPGDESSEDEEGTEKDVNDVSDDGEYSILY